MTIWFYIVLALGVLYVLNRLTTTTDLPVSTVLARAREIAEGGGDRDVPSPVRVETARTAPLATTRRAA